MDTFEKIKETVDRLGSTFDSHEFLERFIADYEDDYRTIFSDLSLQATHAKLARLLSTNKERLHIEKTERKASRNFHGNDTEVRVWKKVTNP